MNKKTYDKMFKENLKKLKITQKGIIALSNHLQQNQLREKYKLSGNSPSYTSHFVNRQDLADASEIIYKIASRLKRLREQKDE